jgi:hypothetical protein
MPRKKFNLAYWMTAMTTAAVSWPVLAVIAIFGTGHNPPKPEIPLGKRTYLAAYTDLSDHYILKFGLFGFADRIRSSDVLILGSSHAVFGLSAEAVSVALSERCGRPILALNLGVAADGMGFAREVLEANDARGQTLLVDLYSNDQGRLSSAARKALHSDILGAYIAVAAQATEFIRDWLLDGFLPRIRFRLDETIRVERFLRAVITRRWDNGDLDEAWSPKEGGLFRRAPPKNEPTATISVGRPKGPPPTLLPEYANYLKAKESVVVLTLIPYDGHRLDEAMRFAAQIGKPFLEIAPDDLGSFDSGHLNEIGRGLATKRLVGSLPICRPEGA